MQSRPQVRLARTPDGRRIEVSRDLPVDRMLAWELLTDTWRWPDWGPTVTDVEAPDRFISAGDEGKVRVLGGPWVSFAVTFADGERWTWDVAGIPATGHRAEYLGEEQCRVVFEVPLLAAGYVPVCQRALSNIARILLEEPGERNETE
ncbi:SRPBCC family protein [Haloarchaeobius amylolyticus]|uniref:SRPBCC family protein n=1 Tax=Haloarchaeobius amylolyticus TaxID=1198296 RepID=UPI00226E3485|nr:SRPBCC family protein [Haloarchaeobius amylolyticus]